MKWCTYSWFSRNFPQKIGKISDYNDSVGNIKYYEKQLFPMQSWDMRYVEVFDNLEDAIIFMLKNNPGIKIFELEEMLLESFPKDAKKVKWDVLRSNLKA
jgi:hypothetical protein